jgi:hypothetical protein
MERKRAVAVVLCTCGLAGTGKVSADVLVRFEPVTSVVQLNDEFMVQIVADIDELVVGWGLDLTIVDGDIASLDGVPDIGDAWVAAFAPDGDGLSALAFPDSVSGPDTLLATLTFSADSLGETDLLLSVTPGDLTEGFALDPTGFANVQFIPGHIQVVPEPNSGVLGLTGLVVLRRRFRCRTLPEPSRPFR